MSLILAGDIGGTKTLLAIFKSQNNGKLEELCKKSYPSNSYTNFNSLLKNFISEHSSLADKVITATFGVAGPVLDQRCMTTKLPWIINAIEISNEFQIPNVHLLNDLEATAYGILTLNHFHSLNPNAQEKSGHFSVIAAGTGLGEVTVFFDGREYHTMPSEGGHCDFAPQTPLEDQLIAFLRNRFKGHVSMDRILSGDGFGNLYDFLKSINFAPVNPPLEERMKQEDRNAVISHAGLHNEDPLCTEVMKLFCRIYGAEAGNLALKALPFGGIYIAGGIAKKIRPALESGIFMEGFLDKGRLSHSIEHIPIRLVDNEEAPLLGAANFASKQI
ncbi:glucokinase [Hydrogenovibrio kuenenii]|uniref:glucokinase n=1 Tax=Hydrogenovibrio kuenenii TaxID=63658 RepID=UPI000465C17F|nr:glucokinase [Hydrogenovibrio kuenenii]